MTANNFDDRELFLHAQARPGTGIALGETNAPTAKGRALNERFRADRVARRMLVAHDLFGKSGSLFRIML
jgi:hypothetical protein